jgi:spore germination cell wall hydrolase CwlJ-like protein
MFERMNQYGQLISDFIFVMAPEPEGLSDMVNVVYGEVRSDGEEGRRAVAHVVKNRAAKKGDSIATVCTAKGSDGEFQFKAYNTQFKVPTVPADLKAYNEIVVICRKVLKGEDSDPVDGATHFCQSPTPPFAVEIVLLTGKPKLNEKGEKIRIPAVKQIGVHYFFKGIAGRYK